VPGGSSSSYFFGGAAGAGVEAAGLSVSFFFFSGFRLSPI